MQFISTNNGMVTTTRTYWKYWLAIVFSTLTLMRSIEASTSQDGCTPISPRFTLCKDMAYNRTMFPNSLNHRNFEEASTEMAMFGPLIKVGCSDDLQFFLCSVYAPVCMTVGPLPPCKELCEKAKSGCISIMRRFGFLWPDYLRCDRYPESGEGIVCVHKPSDDKKYNGKGKGKGSGGKGGTDLTDFEKVKENWANLSYEDAMNQYHCPAKQHKDSKHYMFMGNLKCAAECKPIHFTTTEKEFARNWVIFWSIVCMLSTTFTLLTFIVDMPRFRYPERPIIFLSGCYFVVAAVFLAGPLTDDTISCHQTDDGHKLLNQGTENASCTVSFMLVYFFLMSASIWWVILTLTWFLAAGLKWGHEAIEGSSQYFHAAAWAIPAAKTIAILAMNRVDGDLLSGVCFVGGKNLESLRGFVLAPLFTYLVLGTLFLFAGFIALIRIRSVLKTDRSLRTDKLTRLMIRIGIFAVLYSLPAIIVIACLFYEQRYRRDWDKSWVRANLDMLRGCNGIVCEPDFVGIHRPDFAVFMIKYLMLLMVGITSGFWIWSGKTLASWRRFYHCKILKQRVPNLQYETNTRHEFSGRTVS